MTVTVEEVTHDQRPEVVAFRFAAQWNTGICTAILGGSFWVAQNSPGSKLDSALTLPILGMVFGSLWLSIWAMVVRKTKRPPEAKPLDDEIGAILGADFSDDEIKQRGLLYLIGQSSEWVASITDDSRQGARKADAIRRAQWTLLPATLLIAFLAGARAINPAASSQTAKVPAGRSQAVPQIVEHTGPSSPIGATDPMVPQGVREVIIDKKALSQKDCAP